MTEENIELTVEELNSIAGGRTLTDAEQQDILWAAKKIKSISATDSYAKKYFRTMRMNTRKYMINI